MHALIVRPAVSGDIPRLAELWQEKRLLLMQADRRFGLLPDAAVRWAAAAETWLNDERCALLVAEDDTLIYGYIIVWIQAAPPGASPALYGWVTDVAVDAHRRAGGVGRMLVEVGRDWLAQRDITTMVAQAARRYPLEQAFWRALGATDWIELLWLT